MNHIELTKVVDWNTSRNDKKIVINLDHVTDFEEVPNGNGCTAIRFHNGKEIHVREIYSYLLGIV